MYSSLVWLINKYKFAMLPMIYKSIHIKVDKMSQIVTFNISVANSRTKNCQKNHSVDQFGVQDDIINILYWPVILIPISNNINKQSK